MFKVLIVYPDILNYIGDLGNVVMLEKRLLESNIPYSITNMCISEKEDFNQYDFIYFPGGKTLEVRIASEKLKGMLTNLKIAIEKEKTILCTGKSALIFRDLLGFEMIEEEYHDEEVVLKCNIVGKPLKIVGYLKGRYRVWKSTTPFGRILSTKNSYLEGVYYKNTLVTSLHGPLLVKNPELMDYLLSNALKNSNNKKLIGCDYSLERKARFRVLSSLNLK